MLITRTSAISNKERTVDLPITADQIAAYQGGMLIQTAFPHLTDDQREFFLTGITAEEWEEEFGDDEDELATDDEAVF